MGIVVSVHRFASIAQVFVAVGTTEPFTLDALHTAIANGRRMGKVRKES